MSDYIKVSAPATLSNFGPGLNTFGLALESPRDIVELSLDTPSGFQITTVEAWKDPEAKPNKPRNTIEGNLAALGAFRVATHFNEKLVFRLNLVKNVPPDRGLGGGSTALAAGAFAMMNILNRSMMDGDLVHMSSEAVQNLGTDINMSGVAASMFGGFIVASSYKKTLTIAKIANPDLFIALVMPKVDARPEKFARAVPAQLHQHEAASNVGRTALVIHALGKNDMKTVCGNINDIVAHPERAKLIPGFKEVKAAGEGAGALSVSISGTGPAVFGLCPTEDVAKLTLEAMKTKFKDAGVSCEGYVTRPGNGATVIEQK